MVIKHIVLSCGAHIGFSIYGSLSHLVENKFVELKNIQTIYATSVGSFIALLICLPIEKHDILDYVINRPWDNVFPLHPSMFMDIYNTKGLYDDKFIRDILKPIFATCDISMDITMSELYDYTKIEHHFFSVDLINMEIINISYKTHPELPLIKALHMSSAIPYVIKPVFYEDKCCIDGGIISNFPLDFCIQDTQCSNDEIIGIKSENSIYNNNILNTSSTLLDMTYMFLYHSMNSLKTKTSTDISNILHIPTIGIGLDIMRETITSKDQRQLLINDGIEIAETFLASMPKR